MSDPIPNLAADLRESLAEHRAKRRQRALDALRKAAETSESASKLLAQVDPRGDLHYWPQGDER